MSELPVALVHGFAASCATTWRDPGWFDLLADTGREVIGIDLEPAQRELNLVDGGKSGNPGVVIKKGAFGNPAPVVAG